MLEGRTSTGYEYSIDESILKDWRFVRNLSKLTELEDNSDAIETDFINIMSELEKIIFADKGKSLEKHIQSLNNGKVPTDILLRELVEIIKSKNEIKN